MQTTSLNKTVLITAGPTREAIDPVRYISNHSSGKMGYAIAKGFLNKGYNVVLVSGVVNISLQHENLKMIKVVSADEMHRVCLRYFPVVDIAVFAAAVADYKPAEIAVEKIKKNEDSFNMRMVKNVDIAYEFGLIKKYEQVSIGFALETNDEETNAVKKLLKKNFDIIVLNSMNDANATFGCDTNKITIFKNNFQKHEFPLKQKDAVAEDIVQQTILLTKTGKIKESVRLQEAARINR